MDPDSWTYHRPRRPRTGLRRPSKPRAGKLGQTQKVHPHDRRLERKLKDVGAKRQPGSGNQPGKKGDIELREPESLVLEGKSAVKRRSIVVTISLLAKIAREARDVRKTAGFALEFLKMPKPYPRDWVLVPLPFLKRLIQAAGWEIEEAE